MTVTIDGRAIAPRVAPVWRRLAALVIDTVICFILIGIPSLMSEVVLQDASEGVRDIAFAVVVFAVYALYHGLVPAANDGRTAGMRLLSVRIVDIVSLRTPSPEKCMIRSVALTASIALALVFQRAGPTQITGPVAIAALLLLPLLREDRRAVHDLAAGTRVVLDPA